MVQSVSRILDIIECLAQADEELSLSQLKSQLNLPPSTLHRLLQVLVERGFVAQNPMSRHYGPGLRIIEMGEASKRNARFDLVRITKPFLKQLTDQSGETSNTVILQTRKIVYVDQVPSPRSVRMFTEVGKRAPLYCTGAGKAILSRMPPGELDSYLDATTFTRVTPRTLTSSTDVRNELESIRERGYSIDDEEFETGVRCVAAPIVNSAGRCIAAISVSGPATRMSADLINVLGNRVRDVSDQCSRQLGYRPPGVMG